MAPVVPKRSSVLILRTAINREAPNHERIKRFRMLAKPFSIENDEITATMKMKCRVIEERYRDLIQGLYERGSENETSLH